MTSTSTPFTSPTPLSPPSPPRIFPSPYLAPSFHLIPALLTPPGLSPPAASMKPKIFPPKDLAFPPRRSALSATSPCVGKIFKITTRQSSSVLTTSEPFLPSPDQPPAQAPGQCPHRPSIHPQSHQQVPSGLNPAGKSLKESGTRGEKESKPSSREELPLITALSWKKPAKIKNKKL